jgi:hypothetical protein
MAPIKPTVPHPNANYQSQPHEEMKRLVNDKYQPTGADPVIDAWAQLGKKFKELATDFNILVNGSQSAWTGRAAEAVRGALGKVGTFADTTGEGFTRTSNAIAQQQEAAVQANKSMPEPVNYNPLDIAKKWAGASIIFPPAMVASPVEMFMKHHEQQEAKAEAVQVMQTRDNTMMAAAMSMPTMESTPKVTQDQGVTQTSSSTHSQSLANVNGYRPPGTTGMPGMPPPGTGNNGTTTPSWVAPQTKDPNLPGNYDPNRPPGGDRNRPPGFPGPGPFPPGVPQGRPGGGPGMRPGGPGGGPGGGAGRGMGGPGGMGGGRGMGSFGPANPGGNAGAMGAGGPGGAGAGAAGRGGAAGAAGMGAGAGAGAGKGGEEDKEHKSNYLVPTDEFFDDDRMVAPPVIGG